MECSNWEEVKKESTREGLRQMPKSSFHHESHFIDGFVDLDELLRETLPQLGEAVKEIEQQNEADQISSDETQEGQKKKRKEKENGKKKIQKEADQISSEEAQEGQKRKRMEKENRKKKIQKEADQILSEEAQEGQKRKRMEKENREKKIQKEADQILSEETQEGQKKKRMEKENRKKKMKKRVCTPSLSPRNEIEGDSKKEDRCEIIRVSVAETCNGTQQPSIPHHTEASSVEAQERKNKHAKKKRKMGPKDLHTLFPPQRKRSELGSDLLSRGDTNEVLVGDDSQSIMPNGNQSQGLTPREIWELRLQYLAMEAYLQMLGIIKDAYISILHSLKASIKQTHN